MPRLHDAASNVEPSRLVAAVARRMWWRHVAYSVLLGAAVMATVGAVRITGDMFLPRAVLMAAIGSTVAAAATALAAKYRSRKAAAIAIERARPGCRNVVITAEELERHPGRSSPGVLERVRADAGRAVDGLSAGVVVSSIPAVAAMTAGAVVAGLSFLPVREAVREAARPLVHRVANTLGTPRIRVSVEPPAYTGLAAAELTDPGRLDVFEGSRVRFEVPEGWRVRFGSTLVQQPLLVRESGYFAVDGSSPEERRLIPLAVIPDRSPTVRISAPAKDLLLPDASATIAVSVQATDDLGLRSLELRYTKVSGSGEQFHFVEGTLPVSVQRSTAREWTADGRLSLGALELAPGDALVYRASARDSRPGETGLAFSDTYFIEIAGPGQVAFEGVEMPPEMERYAMSQQMIVLKLERLRQREPAMTRQSVVEEAASLAAEQRTVRANFIFLLGGHVEDEEEEAAQSHEIQEGRLENTARRDINAAVSHMTRAEQGMTAADTSAALPPARAAVESLQRAFAHGRYLLRALAVRSRLDPGRRLTADLSDAREWRRATDGGTRADEAAGALLRSLIASASGGRVPSASQRRDLAEAALRIDPDLAVWQEVSGRLLAAANADAFRSVVLRVAAQASAAAIPRTPLAAEESPLERALRLEGRR